eukprot:CAMPEP_0194213552 /NCGR_PEP_ID=MMETSP0156-20130528/14236_1 /TAXON_ID=33649 /ORGANISM="Thalassionema nitzschioides, Strain L26-B" /LENGTH=347 /DNA_ID=CAMNT_0038941605 /DNA_START=6 /DNA_END=1046 /DNA_ORIENTATION=+
MTCATNCTITSVGTGSWKEVINGVKSMTILRPSLTMRKMNGKSSNDTAGTLKNPVLAHPSLKPLRITETSSKSCIDPNSLEETHRISNEWMDMDMLIMIRTPNVDDPSGVVEKGSACNKKISEYFRGKKRRFEFQYQFKFKKVPSDMELYMACEIEKPLEFGRFQKAVVSACIAFMRKVSPSFHCTINGSPPTKDGKYEKAHISFELEKAMDRVHITKPGETLPPLGQAIPETSEDQKRRKSGKTRLDWNLQDTYTMAFWSHYLDWADWKVMHIPLVKPFSITTILHEQPAYMQLYLLDANRQEKNKHLQKDIKRVVDLEFFHDSASSFETIAKNDDLKESPRKRKK